MLKSLFHLKSPGARPPNHPHGEAAARAVRLIRMRAGITMIGTLENMFGFTISAWHSISLSGPWDYQQELVLPHEIPLFRLCSHCIPN